MLKMDLEYESGILFIRLEGSLLRKNIYKLNNYIVPVINKHKIKYLVYNFKNLKNIDEAGIDVIIKTKCQIKRNLGKIYLCEVNEEISSKIKRLKIKRVSDELTALKMIEVNM